MSPCWRDKPGYAGEGGAKVNLKSKNLELEKRIYSNFIWNKISIPLKKKHPYINAIGRPERWKKSERPLMAWLQHKQFPLCQSAIFKAFSFTSLYSCCICFTHWISVFYIVLSVFLLYIVLGLLTFIMFFPLLSTIIYTHTSTYVLIYILSILYTIYMYLCVYALGSYLVYVCTRKFHSALTPITSGSLI